LVTMNRRIAERFGGHMRLDEFLATEQSQQLCTWN
jgi:hypothetical protein